MKKYNSDYELVNHLYISFLQEVANKNVNPNTGSGQLILPLIQNTVYDLIASKEIPSQFDDTPDLSQTLQQIENSIKILGRQMADEALKAGTFELHEWSMDSARRKLCPLFPFFREPCN